MTLFNFEEKDFVDRFCLDKIESLVKTLTTGVIEQIKSGPTPAPRVSRTEQVTDDNLDKINDQIVVQKEDSISNDQWKSPRTYTQSIEVNKPVGSAKESAERIMREVNFKIVLNCQLN